MAEKTAIFHRDQVISYGELHALVMTVAGQLESISVPGDRIAIMADNSIFFIAAYFGIIASGRIAVPLSPEFGDANFKYVHESCGITCAFIAKKHTKKLAAMGLAFDHVFVDAETDEWPEAINLFSMEISPAEIHDVDEIEDLAVIIFTSGSTGVPKGVMLTHRNLICNTNSIIEYLELTADDRIMVVLPFSYCFGISLLHTHLRVGGSVVINNQFMFPGKVLQEINDRECTGFAGVPSNFQILLRRSPLKRMMFPTLRYVQQAGGKLTNAFITELREALPTTTVFIMYGQTEATARLSYLPPELLDQKLGSIGKGIPGTTIEVLDKEDQPVKPGETGEIVASGDNIMKGYWNDPEGTAKTIRDGKLYTGDLGIVDEDGFIYLTEREKDIIKSGGYRVSPKEIEDCISEIHDIVEVAAIGVPDDLLGEAIKVFVSLADGSALTEDEIIAHCKETFPPFKVPRAVEIIDTIPKNTSNKVDKMQLRKMEQERRGK
jgi:acyl-CoA synthetase (AMP-forming)/AMP-acid ligase II